ncbi:hypothetical protein F4778DRAFT_414350 [Xylariomycetidae sp. FL2044]|nr:hypothetical protein F4778DRAFT_414350 [Xylariomycetidae sp. FL2044]
MIESQRRHDKIVEYFLDESRVVHDTPPSGPENDDYLMSGALMTGPIHASGTGDARSLSITKTASISQPQEELVQSLSNTKSSSSSSVSSAQSTPSRSAPPLLKDKNAPEAASNGNSGMDQSRLDAFHPSDDDSKGGNHQYGALGDEPQCLPATSLDSDWRRTRSSLPVKFSTSSEMPLDTETLTYSSPSLHTKRAQREGPAVTYSPVPITGPRLPTPRTKIIPKITPVLEPQTPKMPEERNIGTSRRLSSNKTPRPSATTQQPRPARAPGTVTHVPAPEPWKGISPSFEALIKNQRSSQSKVSSQVQRAQNHSISLANDNHSSFRVSTTLQATGTIVHRSPESSSVEHVATEESDLGGMHGRRLASENTSNKAALKHKSRKRSGGK